MSSDMDSKAEADMDIEVLSHLTEIQSFYFGRSVFLTGVTGLIGKVILEKLLRCCPGIGNIYVLMRPKRGLTPQQRLDKMFKLELFNELKKILPSFPTKVIIVEGDATERNLGLSFEDTEKLIQNVSVAIHSAADVTYNRPLKVAVELNIHPVGRIIDLCRNMPHLKAFVHVSTAFVKRENNNTVLEKIPKLNVTTTQLLDALEWLDDESLKKVEDFILSSNGNYKFTTYLISKALAENLIDERKENLPIGIVRPCYINASWKDPFPGWIDSVQGVSGLFLAGCKGVLRTLLTCKNLKVYSIPVDVTANTIIACAWHVGTAQVASPFIVNCVMPREKVPHLDEDFIQEILSYRDKYPLQYMFRYPDVKLYSNVWAYRLHALIDQWIPAVIIDFFLLVFTGKTVLMKVYLKISVLYSIMYKLGKEEWIRKMDNHFLLCNSLSKGDAEIFFMDTSTLDWKKYIEDSLFSARRLIAHEDPSNIPYAKKKAKIWLYVTTAMKWLLTLCIFYQIFYSSLFAVRS